MSKKTIFDGLSRSEVINNFIIELVNAGMDSSTLGILLAQLMLALSEDIK